MRHELKQKVLELRLKKQMSYKAISDQLSVPKSTLSEWLRNYPLSRERMLELKRINLKKQVFII